MKNSPVRILITDDDKNLRKVLANELSYEGFDVAEADRGTKAIEFLEKEECDILLLDLKMPEMGGIDVLKKIKGSEIPVEVIILTAYASVPTAVDAMKLGAYDYLTKPFKMDELKTIIQKAYEKKQLLIENISLKTHLRRQSALPAIVTKSPLMLELLGTVKKFAQSEFPVLVCGDSGVGKELIARAVHDASEKAEGPFVPINCGAIPENMLESELFGYEKGAFTGAYARKLGLFEIANYGTILLDEIGDMPLQLQIKLMRVIETQSFLRLGGIREIRLNLKFIFATNKDLKAEVDKGHFRQDLYYRVSSLILHIPPLRERKEDIPLLIQHCININPAFKNKGFTNEALRILSEYSWPGNVRELQNVIHRVFLLSKKNIIDKNELPADLTSGHEISGKRMEDVEREHILRVLKEVDGNKGKASEVLGINPKTLYRKLMSYGIVFQK